MSFDLFPSFLEFYFRIYRLSIIYLFIQFISRPFIVLHISAFLLYCFLIYPLVYLFIYWFFTSLCIYFFIYLMLVLYLQNPFCKPLQISQIEYSDGASIILNLTGSKKEYVSVLFSFIDVFVLSIACIWVFIDLFVYFFLFIFGIFFDLFHPSLYFRIYRPIMYYSSFYLVYVSSVNSSRYVGLSFVLFLDLSIYLSIYLLIIGLLMYLLVHLFYVRSLSTKFFLQTFPDFTDRIFRWSFHHSELL